MTPRMQRATQMMKAVADAPAKTPLVYWPIALAIMAFGFYRLEMHPHVAKDYVHLGSDWAIVALGVAFLPGASQRVRDLLRVLGPFLPLGRKHGDDPNRTLSGRGGP